MASSSSISNSRSWSNASKFFTRDKAHMCKEWDEGKVADEDWTPTARKGSGNKKEDEDGEPKKKKCTQGLVLKRFCDMWMMGLQMEWNG